MATSAIGRTAGMLFALASATDVRRRLAWRGQHEFRSMDAPASEKLFWGPKHWD
jgi:hypothetical protein